MDIAGWHSSFHPRHGLDNSEPDRPKYESRRSPLLDVARYTTYAIKHLSHDAKLSYSQNGEDIIMAGALKALKRPSINYLDIGAHAPRALSNTYLFYKGGHRGVTIEPNPALYREHRVLRPEDTCLNVGVSINGETEMDYYMFAESAMNTFSKEQAEYLATQTSHTSYENVRLPLVPINNILGKHFWTAPNVISIDTEGADFAILQSLDFSNWRPDVFCVETITFTENGTERKIDEILEFVRSKKYFVYADTYINTIFVNRDAWDRR